MTIADPSQVVSPPAVARFGVLEVDAFCAGCHYNLHGQVVTLDDRLGIAVCRCPECGRFHPAGSGVTASSIWVRRFATLLLLVWVLVVLAVTAVGLLTMAGVSNVSIEAFTDWRTVAMNGKPVVEKTVNGTTVWVEEESGIVAANTRSVYTIRPFLSVFDSDGKANLVAPLICAVSVMLGLVAGMLFVTLLWHWPRHRYLWCLLLPLVPAALLAFSICADDQYEFIRGRAIARIAGQTGLQCAGILLGVMVGRKVSRTLVRMIVPPKARQLLAFLWLVDGKPMPSAMATQTN